jgi:hypothetical protein
VAELDADVRLIRLSVFDESRIAIDPHQRPALAAIVGREAG